MLDRRTFRPSACLLRTDEILKNIDYACRDKFCFYNSIKATNFYLQMKQIVLTLDCSAKKIHIACVNLHNSIIV